MRLEIHFLAICLTAGVLLCSGRPAAAQTATPAEDPFHIITGTTRGAAFSIHNTTSESLTFFGSGTITPLPFTFSPGSGFTPFTLVSGETRLVGDLFRLGSDGAPGDTGTFQYELYFNGVTSRSVYTATGSMQMITDAHPPGTVPEPSTAALLLPALSTIPLWKLGRKLRLLAA